LNYFQVRDIVREHVGRDRLAEHSLNWCMERGLREIEKTGNYYWMEATKTFSLVVDQGDYSVYTSASGGLNIPNFKDSRILLMSDQTLSSPGWDEVPGPEQIESVKPQFQDDDEGEPQVWTKKEGNTDVTLQVWPPNPNKTYSMELHYYQWTSLPTDVTSDDHEVLMRWPEALIYLAVEQGMILATKDLQAGAFWRSLFSNPNPTTEDELKQITRYHVARAKASRTDFAPIPGALGPRTRWRRSGEIWL
jgi:hypothetical protein